MAQPDYRGARGSNAGDDFHELWALRQALTLLDQNAGLTAVAVEGLRAEDESGTPLDTWDGVDCTFYYGGDHTASAERIIIDQLKYSAANPDQAWTIARLTRSTNKNQDNSVVGRLAKAFAGLKDKRPDLVVSRNLVVRLVSNQQVDLAVVNALPGQSMSDQSSQRRSEDQSNRAALLRASGLQDEEFEAFARVFDLSECGRGSRFAIEERILTTISEWTDNDARTAVNDLLRFVHRAMLPEARGEFITRQSILAWMGFSDPGALFPCPSALKPVEQLIPRGVSQILARQMKNGEQRICLHGEGGCGKTTALQEIEALLPSGSVDIVFDCYGSGRYLDSDAYRHRPRDAFLQLSNDLARQLRIPLLVSRSEDLDYPKVFKKRLEKAAEVVASRSNDALLVVVVDAADNSVTAASTQIPPQRSFVHDFLALGDLPKNVRLLVTARTGRLSALDLPRTFSRLEIKSFERGETAAHVRSFWRDASDAWIDDFNYLSNGNPRVQRYALKYAGTEPARALDYLRPSGKGLDQIFQEQLEHALHKEGHDRDIKVFCSGLIALQRPIPIADLSAVTYLSEAHIFDLCADFAPGVRLTNGLIGFADEDFEHFVRTEGEAQLGLIQAQLADHFLSHHRSDPYAAAHVAVALFAAGRGREILDLINEEREPTVIGDPVLRREAQLQRLRIAMKVCRETSNNVDAILTLLIGAEALKTDAAIRRTLVENPDLAAYFARDTSSRVVLRDPDQLENHGPLLFHLMAADARDGNGISVREGHRQARAWMQRRTENFEEQSRKHTNFRPQGWSIDDRDIAAQTEAVLRIAGPRRAGESLLRWSPRLVALRVATILSYKLITLGETSLIERCLAEARISTPWDVLLLTPLALAGKEVDLSRLEASVASLLRRGLIRLDRLKDAWSDNESITGFLDTILTACEVIVARGGDRTRIVAVLERFADRESRRRDRLYTSEVSKIDFSLRAHALLERLAERRTTLESYWVDPPDPPWDLPPKEIERLKRTNAEKREELQSFVGPLVDLYDVRAQALVGSIPLGEVDTQLRNAIVGYHNQEYRFSRKLGGSEMRTRAALSITWLMALPGLDRAVLLKHASSVLGSRSDPFGSAEAQIFASLALDRSLHQQILNAVTVRARTVRSMKASAEDKLAALIRLSRLLVPISHADAKSLFNEAIEVAGEVDAEAIHEVALFAPLSERAVERMNIDERRMVARDLAIIVSDAGIRLQGHKYFPWEEAAQALTTLDVCCALAATARWEDSSLVDRDTLLPCVFETALSCRALSPAQVVALSPLLDHFSDELIARVIQKASDQNSAFDLKALSEELTQEELLRFGEGRRLQVTEKLRSLQMKDGPGFWLKQLLRATMFHRTERPIRAKAAQDKEPWGQHNERTKEQPNPLDSVDWSGHRFITTEDINNFMSRVQAAARVSDTFLSASTIFDRIRTVVRLGDWVAHLEALSHSESQDVPDYELAQAIVKCIDGWREAPSVNRWCQENLMRVVVRLLPSFSRWLANGESPLPKLLEKCGASDRLICAALLEGMERHVDRLSASTVYALVGLVGRYCTPEDAALVIARYAVRLVQRIRPAERDSWDLDTIPTEPVEGLARFLYAFMGDIDVRSRWRAVHALRRLVRLGEARILDELVGLYGRTLEPSYRNPEAPFYWLAARLWLVMALSRIAEETPFALKRYGQQILEIATDDAFPHVLLRSFAKSAASKLVEVGALDLDSSQRKVLARANISPVRRKKGRRSYGMGFKGYSHQERESRRFHFDSTDTLPYWYSDALRVFADLSGEEFLNIAERWIVDRWGIQGETWQWDNEPRQQRFSNSAFSSLDHGHGSLPTLERFHTYLEWHAMWCATGELMQTHTLEKADEDDYGTFEYWLNRKGLTAPPLWLADLHGPKPLEDRLWFAPQDDVDAWVEDVNDDDFLAELGLISEDGSIVVGGHHDTRSRSFHLSAWVHTALVSPDTAAALVRALQTVHDSWDYRIPSADEDSEINVPPYKLVGWLVDVTHDSGIDERDPLRYEVRSIECRPSSKIVKALNIKFDHDGQARWIEAIHGSTVFTYEAWGDTRGDERDERIRYDEIVRSSGWRLRVNKEALRAFLNKMNLDLIVEVEIERRNKGYEYSRHDEEKAKEARFDRVVLLRRDGTFEAAEGCLGTWTVPRS